MKAFDYQAQALELVPCNLCGGTASEIIAKHDRYGYPARTVQCVTCGLRYLNPRMTADGYAQFYAHGYRPLVEALLGRPYSLETIEADQWNYAATLSNALAPWVKSNGRMLDAGGSTGIVGRLFGVRFSKHVCVVDPCEEELDRALNCCRHHSTLEDFDTGERYDTILLCRTIEHLLDPMKVLQRLRGLLEPKGWLYVDAMDVDQWKKDSRYKVDHPYAFTLKTLTALVQKAGWRVHNASTRHDGLYVGLRCSPER